MRTLKQLSIHFQGHIEQQVAVKQYYGSFDSYVD